MHKKATTSTSAKPLATFLLCCAVLIPATISAKAGDSDRFLWKSVPRAQLKLDDKTPLAWNVFQTDKKKEANLVVILLGRRYIALDVKARVAYSVVRSDLQPRGADFESGNLFVQSRVLPTNEWSLRDVGPAELIKLKFGDYGTNLQLELPHPPDLRGLY
ncbi:MAG TPA: hypothetical protein VIH97_07745 [Candidatus Acidoferrales bacterium]|jgi:hypothetical protein